MKLTRCKNCGALGPRFPLLCEGRSRRHDTETVKVFTEEEVRERLNPLLDKYVECFCTWDLDEDHPDFGVAEAEEPLKIVRSSPECPLHTIFATLTMEDDHG